MIQSNIQFSIKIIIATSETHRQNEQEIKFIKGIQMFLHFLKRLQSDKEFEII